MPEQNGTRTNAEFLADALRVGAAHPFIHACSLVPMEPTLREVARWRRGMGRALKAAWKRWPKSKSLPRYLEGEL